MFDRKLKILFAGEASYTNTGFASYYYELMKRLHATGKYRIAEHAAFAAINNPDDHPVKWRFYANEVADPKDPRFQQVNSSQNNKVGAWRFNQVCLDFKPDIVIDLRDPHMFSHEHVSPLRRFYHWIIGPTVDSAPQHDVWLDMFQDADAVYPYSDYGVGVLKDANKNINVVKAMYPGVDLNTYKPLDKREVKIKYGIDPSAKIMGFVGRNQIRKLYPDLLKAFSTFIKKTNNKDVFLYCHTALPEICGWNIPKILLEQDLQNRVLFSYMCTSCDHNFVGAWQGSVCTCRKCFKDNAIHPNVAQGLSKDTMCEIYNLLDLYIQYANCEGLGIPVLEAAACGVPTMGIDHTAISDTVRLTGGTPLKPLKLMRDINMDSERAVTDNDLAAAEIEKFFNLPDDMRAKKGKRAREAAEKNFDWDKIAKEWEDIIDNIKLTGDQGKWRYIEREQKPLKQEVKNEREYVYNKLDAMGRPELKNFHFINDIIQKFYFGNKQVRDGLSQKDVDAVLDSLGTLCMQAQSILKGDSQLQYEDYIEYAAIKEISNL